MMRQLRLGADPYPPWPPRLPRTLPSRRGGDRLPPTPSAPAPLPSLLQGAIPNRALAPALRLAGRLYGQARLSDAPRRDNLVQLAPGPRPAAPRQSQSVRRGPLGSVVPQLPE